MSHNREVNNGDASGSIEVGGSRYRMLMPLGRGGMAEVFLAEALRQGGFRKLVVLKRLLPDMATDAEMRSAFLREAELSARLNHPNIVQVHEVYEDEGHPVLVMEFLDGVTLADMVGRLTEPLPLRIHLQILCQVLAGLHYFHELSDYDGRPLNAVHRDISPSNVMILFEGAVKVLDFGIAKAQGDAEATATGIVKGKLHYMPQEQLTNPRSLSRTADIFAVGVMLWEAVAGKRMWRGQPQGDVMRALVTDTLPSLRDAAPSVDPELEAIVMRALRYEPSERWPTALAFEEALEGYLVKIGGHAQPREISRFLVEQFGKDRTTRLQQIDAASKDGRTSSGTSTGSGKTRPGSLSVSLGTEQPATADPAVRTTTGAGSQLEPQRGPSTFLWLIAAAVMLLVIPGTVWVLRRPSPVAPTQAATVTAPVEVEFALTIIPPEASLSIDGRQVPNPFVGNFPARTALHVTAQAPGYVPQEKLLEAARGAIVLQLQPLPAAPVASIETAARPPTPSASAVATPPTGPAVRHTTVRPVITPQPSVEPSAATSASARPPKAAQCDPPFTIAADGVKVYKPECL